LSTAKASWRTFGWLKILWLKFDKGQTSKSYEDFMTELIVDDYSINGGPTGGGHCKRLSTDERGCSL
jgi:hypothetical protein